MGVAGFFQLTVESERTLPRGEDSVANLAVAKQGISHRIKIRRTKMRLIQNVQLKTKIVVGLGAVTVLMLTVGLAGWYGISRASSGFTNYRELARDSNLCSGLQSEMLMVRMSAKNFMISSHPDSIQKYSEYFEATKSFLDDAQKEINNPVRADDVDSISSLLAEYEDGFAQLVDQQTTCNRMLNETLNVVGPAMERNLTSVMIGASESGDAEAAFVAGASLRNLLLARLYVVKFFSSGQSKDAQRVNKEFTRFTEGLTELKQQLQSSPRSSTVGDVASMANQYRVAFSTLVEASQKRAHIIDNTLDRIGPEIASLADGIRLSVKADQDQLGPEIKESNKFYSSLIGVIGVLGLVLCVGIAITLSRSIIGPIADLVTRIRNAEADYDLKVRFPVRGEDEIGTMAKSLNSFFGSLQQTISHVGSTTELVTAASSQLNSTAAVLTGGAKTTISHSSSANKTASSMSQEMAEIADTTDSMNSSFRVVSESMDQLTHSIGEIAANASQASSVASEATELTNASREIVNELNSSAAEIGSVINVIQDIAELTNLLSLNATIEAARAGEAGKGFAVVASEVKDLASQTARATDDVRHRISEIQSSTGLTVESIEKISSVIAQVDAVSTNIAAAVEQQSVTTSAINQSMTETSVASEKVAAVIQRSAESSTSLLENMAEVESAAESAAVGADQTRDAGESLASLAHDVETELRKFKA